jgi:hypothetical protein
MSYALALRQDTINFRIIIYYIVRFLAVTIV